MGLMNALKYHRCKIGYYLMLFEACGVQLKIKGLFLYCAKNEEIYGIVPRQNFSRYVTLLLKRKLQHVGHKWILCGSHPDCSVSQWVKWVNKCDPLSTLM